MEEDALHQTLVRVLQDGLVTTVKEVRCKDVSIILILLLQDVDECSGSNKCEQVCSNTRGSFTCSCHEGYQSKSNDASTCEGETYTLTLHAAGSVLYYIY